MGWKSSGDHVGPQNESKMPNTCSRCGKQIIALGYSMCRACRKAKNK